MSAGRFPGVKELSTVLGYEQASLSASKCFAKIDLTDAFATEVAVVDPSGDVGYANKKWNDTAKQGGLDLARRWNYLTGCQAATARGCPEASDVALGLREVLDGASDLFVTTYACPFDGRYHWYQVLISPIYRGDQRTR